jgi:hypothetical protein
VRDFYNLEEVWGGKPVRIRRTARRAAANAPAKKKSRGKTARRRHRR